MALMTGISFLLVFIFAPSRGLLTVLRRRKFQKEDFAQKSLLFHVYNHEGEEDEILESGIHTVGKHLNWDKYQLKDILAELKKKDIVYIENDLIKLTDEGREYTIESYEEIISET